MYLIIQGYCCKNRYNQENAKGWLVERITGDYALLRGRACSRRNTNTHLRMNIFLLETKSPTLRR